MAMTQSTAGNSEIFVIGPFPPPHNGAAKNTFIWAGALAKAGFKVHRVETNVQSGSAHNRSSLYHFHRFLRTLKNTVNLLLFSNQKTIVYMVPDGGLGLWYNLLYALAFRVRGVRRVWLHHRNLFNIQTGNSQLRLLCNILGDSAGHIFLTKKMRNTFEGHFGSTINSPVISNAATCDIEALRPEASGDSNPSLKICFLSNLNAEKGFDIAASAFEQLADQGEEMEFLIGGNPTDSQAAARQQQLQQALGARATFLGHISGADKTAFYKDADIFVFPSTYKLEAQPNVLMEALATGASIVSTEHACIPETLTKSHHRLVSIKEDRFAMASDVAEAVMELASEIQTADARAQKAEQNITSFTAMQNEGITQYQDFLTTTIHQVR